MEGGGRGWRNKIYIIQTWFQKTSVIRRGLTYKKNVLLSALLMTYPQESCVLKKHSGPKYWSTHCTYQCNRIALLELGLMWAVIAISNAECEIQEKQLRFYYWHNLIKEVIFKEDKITIPDENIWNRMYCGH